MNRNQLYTLLFIFLFLWLIPISSCTKNSEPTSETHVFSPKELKEDLNYLQQKLESVHPGLYNYTSKSSFDSAFQALSSQLNEEQTSWQFLAQIAQLNSLIKCVHSDIRPSDSMRSNWMDNALIPPFNVTRIGSRYLVNYSLDSAIPNNCEILSINGTSIQSIVNQILPYIPADGENTSRKYHALSNSFSRYYSYFVNPDVNEFVIDIQSKDHSSQHITVSGITPRDFKQQWRMDHPKTTPIRFEHIEEINTGIITLSSFRHDLMEKFGVNYADFLSTTFTRLKENQIPNLIIDLRGNGGGYSEYAVQLCAYLSDTAFQYCRKLVVRSDSLQSDLTYDIPETFTGFPNGIIQTKGELQWPNHSILGWKQPKPNAFQGNVYFLIDGGGASTTSEFASVAHHLGLGTFLGEEVGGSYRGDSGGVLAWASLPHTGIKVRIAAVDYVLAVDSKFDGHGVIPEHKVNDSSDALTKAFNLIEATIGTD